MNGACIKDIVDNFSADLIGGCCGSGFSFFSSAACTMAEARNELYYLLGFVLKKEKVFLLSHGEYVLSETEQKQFLAAYKRRKSGEPLAYLTGSKEFYGRDFFVDSSTLIPRPETELLVEHAVRYLRGCQADSLRVCDLGTGTGCILLSVLSEEKRTAGIGIDINDEAVRLAGRNALAMGLEHRADFYADDFTEAGFAERLLSHSNGMKFSCLLSNPPYIPDFEYVCLDCSVKNYEPMTALVSWEDSEGQKGLHHIEALFSLAEKVLQSRGLLLIEHGYNQGEAVRGLCRKHAFSDICTLFDLAGNERALYALRK